MDVHLSNWRLCGRLCDRLAHVVLPEAFLDRNGLWEEPGADFFVQTRFTDSLAPSRYVRVVGGFFGRGGDPRFALDDASPANLALSFPLFEGENGRFNPHNLATLKMQSADGGRRVFVDFFYMSLLGAQAPAPGLEDAKESGGGGRRAKDESGGPLEEIAAEAAACRASGRKSSPMSVLSGLLSVTKYVPPAARHHRALEDPGSVRGVSIQPENKRGEGGDAGRARQKKRKVRCGLNLASLGKDNITFESSHHLLSNTRFTLCHYPNLTSKRGAAGGGGRGAWESVLDGLSDRRLAEVNPLAALLLGSDFLERAQLGFVNGLVRACEAGGLRVFQKLPVCVEKERDVRGILGDHFVEACHLLARQVNESSAWIRACVAGERGQAGLWADFLNLWESGTRALGVDLSYLFSPGYPDDESVFWSALLGCDPVLDAIKKGARAVLVVDARLTAWLLLPGGFAIKGRYELTLEDTRITVARYG
ncbi:DNA packaging tegument protein UL17 [Equid gammaherpesvirus 5]|uniref:DNA packaging tegument protein UL17 n=1 Tax=Equid gammaherpesvirus 5 TaxID=10371 RepID=A0A0B4Q5I7_9GAMA|nr:DNA packaging tegument protein UL17 [Equid gammaherpesvirus 5]AIU39557.1 DNA packaging tegument protein UL17 [Equid gammaherpesvirus 5]APT43388.1 DNA packaging tegument protein UL17 [Equid gammaherpesvirus 5]